MKGIQKNITNTEAKKKDGRHLHQPWPPDYSKGKSETSDEKCTYFFQQNYNVLQNLL